MSEHSKAFARNRQVVLASRPEGIPQAEHFRIVEATVPEPAAGQVVIRNEWLSVEPAMRGWVRPRTTRSPWRWAP